MLKESVILQQGPIEIEYDLFRFEILRKLREEASEIQSKLEAGSFVYGSLARGDVHPGSDIDIIILEEIDSFQLELNLGSGEVSPFEREIVQATPNHVIKGHIHLNHYTTITFPLVGFSPVEEEFYRFSGICSGEDIAIGRRVTGINKKLICVEPTEKGHLEYSISDRKKEVAKLLGIGMDIIDERVRVLSKRTRYGRTGVFLKQTLKENDTFESRLRYLADRNYIVRKQLKQRGGIR
jgi:hypothetical protein